MKPQERENQRYDAGFENPIEVEEEAMFSLLPQGRTGALLDIGCGMGRISLELQNRGYDVTGIDFSSVAVRRAVERRVKAQVSDVDADGLRFPDATFDVAWAGDVIEHLFDPIFALKEVRRVLKPGGVLLMTVPNDFMLTTRLRLLWTGHSIQTDGYRTMRQIKHHTFFSWDLLQFMLNQAALEINAYRSILRVPRLGHESVSQSRFWGRLFGRTFIVRARKPG